MVLISVFIFCKTTDILRNIGVGECDIIFFCNFTAKEKGDRIEPDNRQIKCKHNLHHAPVILSATKYLV